MWATCSRARGAVAVSEEVSQPRPTVVAMETQINPTRIESSPRRRHDGRVARVSSDPHRLRMLDLLVVNEEDAAVVVSLVCARYQVPGPRLRLHARRSLFTGATERPRAAWVAELGESEVAARESNGWGKLPRDGAIRLGRSTTLMTVAHELAHHLVFHLDPPSTPAHGNVWIGRFDQCAAVIGELVEPQ